MDKSELAIVITIVSATYVFLHDVYLKTKVQIQEDEVAARKAELWEQYLRNKKNSFESNTQPFLDSSNQNNSSNPDLLPEVLNPTYLPDPSFLNQLCDTDSICLNAQACVQQSIQALDLTVYHELVILAQVAAGCLYILGSGHSKDKRSLVEAEKETRRLTKSVQELQEEQIKRAQKTLDMAKALRQSGYDSLFKILKDLYGPQKLTILLSKVDPQLVKNRVDPTEVLVRDTLIMQKFAELFPDDNYIAHDPTP